MLDQVQPQARARERCGADQGLSFALRVVAQAVLVEEFASEGANRGMESPCDAEEETSIGRDGVVLAKQVLESRGVATLGMATLDGLLELLGISEKHDVPCGRGGPEGIGQGKLPGFVDDKCVDEPLGIFLRPGPNGARRNIHLAGSQGRGQAV